MLCSAQISRKELGTVCFYEDGPPRGFSLVEVLVVMIIIGTLAGIAWSGFVGMRTSMILHQSAETFRTDIVNAQRFAMLMERSLGENWIRGVVVDLRATDNTQLTTAPTYSVYKWCTEDSNYTDFVVSDPVAGVSRADCSGTGLYVLSGKREVPLAGGSGVNACVLAPWTDEAVRFIVFESVTGEIHFYTFDLQPITSISEVRATFYHGGKYDTIVVNDTGEISLEAYSPGTSNPCPPRESP